MPKPTSFFLALIVLAVTGLGACGGGGGGAPAADRDPEPVATTLEVTGFAPRTLPSEVETAFEVTGAGFHPVGGSVKVRLVAATGAPFLGGTSSSVDLVGSVASANRITGTSWACGVSDSVEARVRVIASDGEEGTSAVALATVEGPTIRAVSPALLLSVLPHEFEIHGTGFSGSAKLRFSTANGTPFQEGTASSLEVDVTAVSGTRLRGKTDFGTSVAPAWADVTLVCESGAEARLGPNGIAAMDAIPSAGASAGDRLGHALSIEGDRMIVGALGDSGDPGEARIFVRSGGAWTLQQTLTAGDGVAGDGFGYAVAVAGNTALVGAPNASGDPPFNYHGAVYVFAWQNGTWTQAQKLYVPRLGASAEAHFGRSVAFAGETAVVGAPSEAGAFGDANGGAVYVYVRDAGVWMAQQRLLDEEGAANHRFGATVATHGGTVAVGAPGDEVVCVFSRGGGWWTCEQRLRSDDPGAAQGFGRALALDDETLVVGAPDDDEHGAGSGSAYIFTLSEDGWVLAQKLDASNGETGDAFGHAVDIDGAVVLVGTPGADDHGGDAGAARLFARVGARWGERARLFASDSASLAEFGSAVGCSGGVVAVGAPNADAPGASSGAVYGADLPPVRLEPHQDVPGVLLGDVAVEPGLGEAHLYARRGTAWVRQQTLAPDDLDETEVFGWPHPVARDGDTLVVGAPYDDERGEDRGAVYVFVRREGSWVQQQKLTVADEPPAGHQLRFGSAVAISGDTIVASTYYRFDLWLPHFGQLGHAYVFVRSGGSWTLEQKLVGVEGVGSGYFGDSLAIDGDTIVSGARNDQLNTSEAYGAAYVFVRSDGLWTQQQVLKSGDSPPPPTSSFGEKVAVSGDRVAVSCPWQAAGGFYSVGAVYVFTRSDDTWTREQKIVAPDAEEMYGFGHRLALRGEALAIRVAKRDEPGLGSGGIYLYRLDGGTWTFEYLARPVSEFMSLSDDTIGVGTSWEFPRWDDGP